MSRKPKHQPAPTYYTPPPIITENPIRKGEGRHENPRKTAGNPANKPANVHQTSKNNQRNKPPMKKKQPTTKPAEEPLCRERYLLAKSFVHCDGCGEDKAIAKGTKYLQYLADDNASHLNFCPRCLLALKFRKSSTDAPFEVHPLDFQFDKLPRRFQSAWKTLSQRLTRQLHQGRDLNEAWQEVVSRLMDELGMKHLCARDYELAEQAQKFAAIRKSIEREVAALRKNLKSIKADTNAALDRMAKARLSIKVAMTRCQTGGCGACGIADAAEAMQELADAMVDVRKAWERI